MNIEALLALPLFADIDSELHEPLCSVIQEEHYKAGDLIFEEHSMADKLFIIQEGEVSIFKAAAVEEGTPKLIAILGKGEFFGEMAVFVGPRRTARATAKTEVQVLVLNREDFSNLVKSNPAAAYKIMEFLMSVTMDRLSTTTRDLVTLYEIGRQITSAHSVSHLTQLISERIKTSIEPAEASIIVLWNEYEDDFDVATASGYPEDDIAALPVENQFIQWFIESGEPFISFDLEADERITLDSESPYKCRSILVAPFLSQDRLMGYITLLNRSRTRAFSYNHMILLSTISDFVLIAIENLKLLREKTDRWRLEQIKWGSYRP